MSSPTSKACSKVTIYGTNVEYCEILERKLVLWGEMVRAFAWLISNELINLGPYWSLLIQILICSIKALFGLTSSNKPKTFLKFNQSFCIYLTNFIEKLLVYKELNTEVRKILLLVEAIFWFMHEGISYLYFCFTIPILSLQNYAVGPKSPKWSLNFIF